jgi:hypothetical protein
MTEPDRRFFLAGLGAVALTGLPGRSLALAPAPGQFRMWHSPGCGCCLEWGKRMEAFFKRKLTVIEAPDMAAVKRINRVPKALQSCHTALIQGVVVEGHVPPADIRRLIQARNKNYIGLAVPGMPAGAPGMDVGHDRQEPYQVHAFTANGARSIFASHGS